MSCRSGSALPLNATLRAFKELKGLLYLALRCPIQMTPMFEPVRIIHEDEELRAGQPPHVMDLQAANRWLFGSEGEAGSSF